jgi:histidine triad (HIT) family protein
MRNLIVCLFICISIEAFACPFCRQDIIVGQSVFEGDHFRVLIDYEPRTKGHLLLVTKRHVAKAHELSKEEWEEIATVLPKVVGVFSGYLGTDQYIMIEKNGRSAFQQVPHVHFHLFPMHSQTWAEIFDIVPRQLTNEEIENEVSTFRQFFLKT